MFFPNTSPFDMYVKSCYCGADLNKVKLAVPKKLKLEAICGLSDLDGNAIDLRGKRIAFDHPVKNDLNGTRAESTLYLSGELILSGEVRYEPGEAGSLYLNTPDANELTQSAYLATKLRSIELDGVSDKIKIPDKSANCLVAQATIKVHGLQIVNQEGDANGATPKNITILKISEFTPCMRGG
jgi:hypothetical protein